jgi:uncharacterized protein YoxC
MTEEIKDVNKAIDDLDANVKKYASKDTVISIGGYEFTPAKLMVAFTIVSSILGGLYGAFEVYKDYQNMKDKIAKYVSPDLTEIYKKLEVLDANTNKMVEYSETIKNDLKNDVRRLEGVVENVERSTKTDTRLTESTVKDMKRENDQTMKDVRRYSDQSIKEMNQEVARLQQEMARNQKEIQQEIRGLRGEVDSKIKKALDNPLNN